MQTTLAQFNETQSQDAFALQNSKLLKVRLDQVTVQAKLGSMVAYQGDVTFEHAGLGRDRPDAQEGGHRRGHAADEDHRHRRGVPRRPGAGHPPDLPRERHDHGQRRRTCSRSTPGIDWDIKRVEGGARARWPAACSTWRCTAPAGWRSSPTARRCCSTSPRRRRSPTRRPRSRGPRASRPVRTDFKMKNLIGRGSGESIQVGPGLGRSCGRRGAGGAAPSRGAPG